MNEHSKACGIKYTLSVMGGKWKTQILANLLSGTVRFGELHKSIEGVNQRMLTQQLRELESGGLIKRKVYPVVPPKVEYSLTKTGESLVPVLCAMCEWGGKHKPKKQKTI